MNVFLNDYIAQLSKFCKVPKFQNERAISMIISLFLEKIVFEILHKQYRFVTIELPIVKDATHQTTNIDYLMVGTNNNALLIELKTEKQANNRHFWKQIKEYSKLKKEKTLYPAFKKVVEFERNKTHQIKYIKQQEIIGNSIENINNIEIMYIVPDCILEKELTSAECDFIDYKVGFSKLIELKIDNDWEIIKEYLKVLNT